MRMKNHAMIVRDTLLHLFDTSANERLFYVCAPAGYGKTVAVRQWLDSNNSARVVISLDEYDNNLKYFCERLCTALRACQPKNSTLIELITHPAFSSAPEAYTLRAIPALATGKQIFFVLDDLHFIYDEKVLRFLRNVLDQLPKIFKIILISRNELPLGLSEIWADKHFVVITAEQLRFSHAEIMLLYKKRGHFITQAQADDIYRFTNGWPIGINALLLSGNKPSDDSLEYLDAFIRSNIWGKWDADTREFMLRTAAARELHPALCTLLTGVSDSEKKLCSLMLSGAFISQSSDKMYHYQFLFHEFLKHMLAERGNAYVYPLLQKEGEWHLSRRDFYSAIDCFIRCEDSDGVAKCLELLINSGHAYFYIDKLISVTHTAIIHKVAENIPYIYSLLSWAAFNEGHAEDMARYADLYYQNQAKIIAINPRLQLNIILVRLVDCRFTLRELMEYTMEMFANNDIKILPGMEHSIGTINQNMPLLHRGTRDFSECAMGDVHANIIWIESVLGKLFGTYTPILLECLLAGLYYEQGHLEKAHSHAANANAQTCIRLSAESTFFSAAIFIYILDAMGEDRQAEQVLNRIGCMIESENAYYLTHNYKALSTRRKQARGDAKAAETWLNEYEVTTYGSLNCYDMYATFTTCRAYISTGQYDQAIILLTRILNIVQTYKRPLGIIETHVLIAIAYWQKKRTFQEEALRHLETALTLAYPYGFTQIFINESHVLIAMLQRMQKRAEQPESGVAVPKSFLEALCKAALKQQGDRTANRRTVQPVTYTEKQKTVMQLLCAGKSYKEIADDMGIKLSTLRSHISLIYKKLDVTGETEAILKIKSLDILYEA